MTELLSAGSAWRRWEPHIHLPGTLFNDNFGSTTLEEALDALAQCSPAIEVVGVTDYFTTRSFRRAQDAWRRGAGAGLQYLFPNVELRLNDATARGSGVNLHLLASAADVHLLDEILGRLTFTHRDVEYQATDAGLIALGRAYVGATEHPEDAARREGARQFKVSFEQVRTLFLRDARFRERVVVAVAAGADGTSGLQATDGGFVAYRQGLERFAHAIFTGNDRDREFWLGRGTRSIQEIESDYHSLKVCLHGSDAHEASRLGKPDLDRFTWLKGDPDFDTLWQACLAPERRSHIGPATPAAGQHGRITAVRINDDSWFTPGVVPLNTGLVAVIGPRGSGKTALADLVAVGAGSLQPFATDAAFVHRAAGLLAGSTATVDWYDDESTMFSLASTSDESPRPRRVRYLSQQFVERLCASDGVRPELLHEIERVIFEAWPVERRQGATSFQDLLNIRLAAARSAQREELGAIAEISESITQQRVLKSRLGRMTEERSTLTKSIATIEDQIKELTGKANAASSHRHALVSQALATRRQELQAEDRRLTDLQGLKAAASTASTAQFPAFLQRLQEPHRYTRLTDAEWQAFLPKFSGDVDGILTAAIADAEARKRGIAGVTVDSATALNLDPVAPEDLLGKTVGELTVEQARLQQLVGLDQKRAGQLTQFQQQLATARAAAAKLDLEIADAAAADDRIATLVEERTRHYTAYFNALLHEEQELGELYAPLDELLQGFGDTVAKLKLSVRRRVDIGSWVKQGEDLIDLRTAGPFRGSGSIRPIVERSLAEVWATGDGTAAAAAIQQFSEEYSNALRTHSRASQDDEDSYRAWERDIAKWLYSVGHIKVTYSLDYDGLSVERLSPGSRGIVLLLLYLAVDQAETDPLIIDQPEENLDPKSVYAELVDLFQRAAERRQIIMITHNANLVVNTDVDQVIVASCGPLEEGRLPRLSYEAGGLENPAIRKAVCEVLEGGADAFRQRARRLHIDAPAGQPIES